MGPSAPIKGFALGPSSTHLEGAFRQSPAHKKKRPLTTWSSKSWLLKGQALCQVKSLERGLSEKGPMLWTTSPGFWKHPLCRYPTFLCLIFGWIFPPITSECGEL